MDTDAHLVSESGRYPSPVVPPIGRRGQTPLLTPLEPVGGGRRRSGVRHGMDTTGLFTGIQPPRCPRSRSVGWGGTPGRSGSFISEFGKTPQVRSQTEERVPKSGGGADTLPVGPRTPRRTHETSVPFSLGRNQEPVGDRRRPGVTERSVTCSGPPRLRLALPSLSFLQKTLPCVLSVLPNPVGILWSTEPWVFTSGPELTEPTLLSSLFLLS